MLIKLLNFVVKFLMYLFLRPSENAEIEIHGSKEGQWAVPKRFFSENSTVILAGAGCDISFDISLYQQYKLNMKIIDPTPRAQQHFDNVIAYLKGEDTTLDITQRQMYRLKSGFLYNNIDFVPFGLWDSSGIIKFFLPKNINDISLSARNIQRTKEFVELNVLTISDLIKKANVDRIDFLKMDIEGAEYKVIDSMFNDGIYPTLLSIEFDEMSTNFFKTRWPITFLKYLKKIRKEYNIFYVDRKLNFTFIKK